MDERYSLTVALSINIDVYNSIPMIDDFINFYVETYKNKTIFCCPNSSNGHYWIEDMDSEFIFCINDDNISKLKESSFKDENFQLFKNHLIENNISFKEEVIVFKDYN